MVVVVVVEVVVVVVEVVVGVAMVAGGSVVVTVPVVPEPTDVQAAIPTAAVTNPIVNHLCTGQEDTAIGRRLRGSMPCLAVRPPAR